MVAVFTAGYMGIVFEEFLAFNKSGVALLMAVSLWVILSLGVKPSKLLLSPSLFSSRLFKNSPESAESPESLHVVVENRN
jgi:hypothetical protein